MDMGMLPGQNRLLPLAISDDAVIVGATSYAGINIEYGFIWLNGQLYKLDDLLVDAAGIHVDTAWEINASGQIVAYGIEEGTNVYDESVGLLLTPAPAVAGDATCDRLVNVDDLVNVLGNWGPCGTKGCPADVNGDQSVDASDVEVVLKNWN